MLTTARTCPNMGWSQNQLTAPQRTSGEEIAVERIIGPTLPPPEARIEPTATAIFDVRSMPLEMLTSDAGAHHMVSRILDRIDGPTRVSVAKFNSAI
jgi:hypothetical protein